MRPDYFKGYRRGWYDSEVAAVAGLGIQPGIPRSAPDFIEDKDAWLEGYKDGQQHERETRPNDYDA